MTQAIVCLSREGLVLATDSLIVQELGNGKVERRTERQILPLGPRAVLASVGTAVGVDLGATLAQWLQMRHMMAEFDDVLALSRDYLAEAYARYLRGNARAAHGAVPRHLYFIIAGSAQGRSGGAAVLLQSEGGDLPFQETRLGHVFTLPRRAAVESKIGRQVVEGASLRTLAQSCLAGLAQTAARNEESVGGPMVAALVSSAGVEFLEGGADIVVEDEDDEYEDEE